MRAIMIPIALAAAIGVAATGPVQAQGPTNTPPATGGPSTASEGATARFSWSMPPRYARGWRAWDRVRERYDRAYVHPSRWGVTVDACASSAGRGARITRYDFTVSGVGFAYGERRSRTRCRTRFALPRLGRYDVTVVVRTTRSTSAPRTQRITLRDHLVVSIGDSLASGEGVPDTSGLYTPPFTLTQTAATLRRVLDKEFRMSEVRRVRWQDRRCHRSARSGHALAARAIEERDPHSSVTFVSLACSGATIANVIDEPYPGQQPRPGSEELPPQLAVLRALVAGRGGAPRRTIDALLLSIGINDLEFADIVADCALNFRSTAAHPSGGDPSCVYDHTAPLTVRWDSETQTSRSELDKRYAELGAALGDRLDVTDVYMTDYPGRPFGHQAGGCGLLGLPGGGIKWAEAQAMRDVGGVFAWTIGRATAANGWNWVPGKGVPEMTEQFGPHHYCAQRPWLNRLERSLVTQGTKHGAVHPNRTGHRAYGTLLARSIVLRAPAPHWRARLVVESVRVESGLVTPLAAAAPPGRDEQTGEMIPPPPASDEHRFDFGVRTSFSWPARETHYFRVPKARVDEWIPVPAEYGVFELDVHDPPRAPRYATGIDFLTYGPSGTAGGWHPYAKGFGAGCHEVRHGTGWSMRYRVEVRRVDAGGGPLAPPRPDAAVCWPAVEAAGP